MVQFGNHLRQTRLESGLTQADMANRLGISKGYISRLESGKARPAEATVRRLAELCATDPDPLLILADYLPPDLCSTPPRHRRFYAAPLGVPLTRKMRPPLSPSPKCSTNLAKPHISSSKRIASHGWSMAPPTASTLSSPTRLTA